MNYTPSGSQTILPTLENGDRLSMIEFERRYSLLPDIKKAELVEGVVFIKYP
ncbi:Uma2 family endonuclease, partial [Arthrospira platensis SPKY2]